MEIALIIVGGLVLMVTSASYFDFLGKKRKAAAPQKIEGRIAALEERLVAAEAKIADRDQRIAQLETDLGFVNKLIEDRSR